MAISYIKNIPKPESTVQSITWKTLQKSKVTVSLPFHLTLPDPVPDLICEELVRLLPGKRLVVFGTWNEKLVVAKLFYQSKKAKTHYDREREGLEALTFSGIPTPKLLWKGALQQQKIYVLIFERIINSITLENIWKNQGNFKELVRLLHGVIIELATQHVLGIVQKDLHLKNFLVDKKQIYTLDGANIIQYDEILPKEQSLDHLALFFSQLGIDAERFQEKLFPVYAKARGWIVKPADKEYLLKQITKASEKRWQRYEKKIQRNSSAFAHQKTSSRLIMYDRDYDFLERHQVFTNPESYFADAETLKAGRSSTVAKIKINERSFVIKRYNLKNIAHRLRRAFRESRAATSWKLAQRLCLFGIPTAKPIAFIENRFLGLRGTSYFIMEWVDGPHMQDYFASRKYDTTDHVEVAHSIVSLITHLLRLHLTHGDLKATNILIHQQRPILIDLDGMEEHYTEFGLKHAFRKEIQRFMKNWERQPDIYQLFENIINRSAVIQE